jgi:hypothetical protein
LPKIKNKSNPAEISSWKLLPSVAICNQKLFEKVCDDDDSPTYMTEIIRKIWPKTEVLDLHAAWAVSIAELILNPYKSEIKVSEELIVPLLEKNLVIFS